MPSQFTTITELPGSKVMPIQIERSLSRYLFGAHFCDDKEVLEVACGGGQGLGLLAKKARRVVGGDCDEENLVIAQQTYKNRSKIEIKKLDAHHLPFEEQTFDVILIYEAIYYLKFPEQFIKECYRILRPQGVVVICTANKNWPDFNPSPFSHHYFSVPELKNILQSHSFEPELYAAFPDQTDSFKAKLRSCIKRTAVRFHLMPKTMKGKIFLKKIFFGKLIEFPPELTENLAPYIPPIRIHPDAPDTIHTAIYAVGKKR